MKWKNILHAIAILAWFFERPIKLFENMRSVVILYILQVRVPVHFREISVSITMLRAVQSQWCHSVERQVYRK